MVAFSCFVADWKNASADDHHEHSITENRLRCEEHDTWEDECYICHPELKAKKERGEKHEDSRSNRLQCHEHNLYEDECGICHPELAEKMQAGQGIKVRLPSRESASKANLQTAQPYISDMSEGVGCYAEIEFNQNKLARVASMVDGIIEKVEVDLGSLAEEGHVLARVWSAAIGKAITKASLAYQDVLRERKLRAGQISAEKDLQEAEAEYQVAKQQLKALGFDNAKIEELMSSGADTSVLEIRAPFSGEIVKQSAVQGAMVKVGTPLFTLTDRSVMWAMINIPEKYLPRIQLGQMVEFTIDTLPGNVFTGKLTWISPQLDTHTRMAKGRAEIENKKGVLKSHMFARARILTGSVQEGLIVPLTALQCVNDKQFVFVKIDEDLYELRAVEVGVKDSEGAEILKGLHRGEMVVTAGSFILKSQLLISRLGAGCTE